MPTQILDQGSHLGISINGLVSSYPKAQITTKQKSNYLDIRYGSRSIIKISDYTTVTSPTNSSLSDLFTKVTAFFPSQAEVQSTVQRFTPLTGGTLTVTNPKSAQITYLIVPAGTLATLTVPFPPTPVSGQILNITTTQTITALTQSGGTVTGGITTLAANAYASFIYDAVGTTWRRLS